MKTYLIILLTSYASLVSFSAFSDPVPDVATESTQLWNHFELAAQVDQLVQQLDTIKDQLGNMKINSMNLIKFNWTDIKTDLDQLMTISNQGEAISFRASDIDEQFKDKYPGYADFSSGQSQNFSDIYKEWSQSSMDGLKNLIKTAKQQSDDFSEEEANIGDLQNSSSFVAGRMQAVQLGNEIATEQVKQMQKLREFLMSQSQAQYSYLASERSEKDMNTAQVESLLKKHIRITPNYKHFQD